MLKSIKILSAIVLTLMYLSCADHGLKKVQESSIVRGEINNPNNPQILYWFITERTLSKKQYLKDIEYIAQKTPFDLVVLTQRKTASFYDYKKMHPIFKEIVEKGKELGVKVALQLWPKNFDAPRDKAEGVIVEKEIPIDGKPTISYTGKSKNVRYAHDVLVESANNKGKHLAPHPLFASPPLYSKLYGAYLFKKTGTGEYEPGSLMSVPEKWINATVKSKEAVHLQFKIPKKYRDYTLYVTTVHYHQYGDLFSDYFPKLFEKTLDAYKGIDFAGGALDEFKYMPVSIMKEGEMFRERWYSKGMANYTLKTTGEKLKDILFQMRYNPKGNPVIREKAINKYFDILRQGPLKVEKAFYELVKKKYGNKAFVGAHDTFHNNLEKDEIWSTGINWWSIPRDYGQTDETTIYPVRMGVACANSNPVMYNMFYSKNAEDYYDEAIYAARYNVRIHYHAFNDTGRWGLDFKNKSFNKDMNKVEDAIELLDNFNPPYPKMDILIVFGLPEQLNWFPDFQRRGSYDIREGLNVLGKAQQLWQDGYTCALAPSYEITNGKIHLNDNNKISYGGKEFSALIYLDPKYLKEDNLEFLEKYVNNGGKLMIEGNATTAFNGSSIKDRFTAMEQKATVKAFDPKQMNALGVTKNDLKNGMRYEDGSVILTDKNSILKQQPITFSFAIGKNNYKAVCDGFLALKTDEKGNIDKVAANNLQFISKNGSNIIRLDKASNIYYNKSKQRLKIEDTDKSSKVFLKFNY
jgi:hypothetical protein